MLLINIVLNKGEADACQSAITLTYPLVFFIYYNSQSRVLEPYHHRKRP